MTLNERFAVVFECFIVARNSYIHGELGRVTAVVKGMCVYEVFSILPQYLVGFSAQKAFLKPPTPNSLT